MYFILNIKVDLKRRKAIHKAIKSQFKYTCCDLKPYFICERIKSESVCLEDLTTLYFLPYSFFFLLSLTIFNFFLSFFGENEKCALPLAVFIQSTMNVCEISKSKWEIFRSIYQLNRWIYNILCISEFNIYIWFSIYCSKMRFTSTFRHPLWCV